MAKKWIAGAIKHPGALHRDLHVPQGKKIPERKLEAAEKRKGVVGERARMAETMEGFHHHEGKSMRHEKHEHEGHKCRGKHCEHPSHHHEEHHSKKHGHREHEKEHHGKHHAGKRGGEHVAKRGGEKSYHKEANRESTRSEVSRPAPSVHGLGVGSRTGFSNERSNRAMSRHEMGRIKVHK